MTKLNIFQQAAASLEEPSPLLTDDEFSQIQSELDALMQFENEYQLFHKNLDAFNQNLKVAPEASLDIMAGWYNTLVAMSHDTLGAIADLEDDSDFSLFVTAVDSETKKVAAKKPGIFKRIWEAIKKIVAKLFGKKAQVAKKAKQNNDDIDDFIKEGGFENMKPNDTSTPTTDKPKEAKVKPVNKETAKIFIKEGDAFVLSKEFSSELKKTEEYVKNLFSAANLLLSNLDAKEDAAIDIAKKIASRVGSTETKPLAERFYTTGYGLWYEQKSDTLSDMGRSIDHREFDSKKRVDVTVNLKELKRLNENVASFFAFQSDNLAPIIKKLDVDIMEMNKLDRVTLYSRIAVVNSAVRLSSATYSALAALNRITSYTIG